MEDTLSQVGTFSVFSHFQPIGWSLQVLDMAFSCSCGLFALTRNDQLKRDLSGPYAFPS